MSLSQVLAQDLANWLGGTDMPSAPAGLFISLHTGDPLADNSGANELTGGGYTRQGFPITIAVDGLDSVFLENTSPIVYNTATATLGSVTHFALFDAAASGNLLAVVELTAPRVWTTGTVFTFNAQQARVNLFTSTSAAQAAVCP